MLSSLERLGEHHHDQVISTARAFGAFERGVVNKFDRVAIRFYPLDVEEPGQLEGQRPRPALMHIDLQGRVGV